MIITRTITTEIEVMTFSNSQQYPWGVLTSKFALHISDDNDDDDDDDDSDDDDDDQNGDDDNDDD